MMLLQSSKMTPPPSASAPAPEALTPDNVGPLRPLPLHERVFDVKEEDFRSAVLSSKIPVILVRPFTSTNKITAHVLFTHLSAASVTTGRLGGLV